MQEKQYRLRGRPDFGPETRLFKWFANKYRDSAPLAHAVIVWCIVYRW